MSKIKQGSKVKWTCKPKCETPFECKGIVTGLKMSTFGSCNRSMGASIKVTSKKYINLYDKKTAFVSAKKLELA